MADSQATHVACVSVYLMQALAGLLVLAPQTVGTAQVEEHHGPGRVHRAGVTLGDLLPCCSGTGTRETHTHTPSLGCQL